MHASVQQARLEELEVQLLLAALQQSHGFDFSEYERPWLERRIWDRVHGEGVRTISGLQEKILHHPASLEALLRAFSLTPTGFFEDLAFHLALRDHVIPLLRTYPSIAVWFPACGTGEEVYAVAIQLYEGGLLSRCRLYATDLHESVYRQAKEGIYPLEQLPRAEEQYRRAGGYRQFSEYGLRKDDQFVMAAPLKAHLVFLEHQLSTDGVFREFQLIVCRHLWPAAGDRLANRLDRLFRESLDRCGVLSVRREGDAWPRPDQAWYEPLDPGGWFYRRIPTTRRAA